MLTTSGREILSHQLGIYRAEWRLEAEPHLEPGADPRPAIGALIESQLGFHKACQGLHLVDAPDDFTTLELKRLQAQAQGIPAEQIQQAVMAALGCLQAWHAARAVNDFNLVAEPFAQLIGVQKQLAQIKAKNLSTLYGRSVTPYEALLDNYDPGRRLAFVTSEFAKLVPVCQALLRDEQVPPLALPEGRKDVQAALIRELVTAMGYDAQEPRGRLGISAHPFTRRVGPREVWLTGKADDELLTDIVTMVHEGAHGRYYQGLPEALADAWSGMVASETINEGMALLAEHMLARRESFAHYVSGLLKKHLNVEVAPADLHAALTSRDRTRLRTAASEPSYPLHLVLRTEIEAALIDGDLDPRDLPQAWAAASQRLLGFVPASNNEGCLQDIHLFAGYLGYFPCYLLGHMAAAQLWPALAAAVPNLDDQIAAGDFAPLNGWLREHIYRHGRTQPGDALIMAASGTAFSADALVAHLQERYS